LPTESRSAPASLPAPASSLDQAEKPGCASISPRHARFSRRHFRDWRTRFRICAWASERETQPVCSVHFALRFARRLFNEFGDLLVGFYKEKQPANEPAVTSATCDQPSGAHGVIGAWPLSSECAKMMRWKCAHARRRRRVLSSQ
jgi:hypothetical protein